LNANTVMEQLGGKLALVVDGGDSQGGIPSTVVDLSQGSPRVLREGPITSEMIDQALENPV
jgi:L-threonylcarbamoyladenylate synthase